MAPMVGGGAGGAGTTGDILISGEDGSNGIQGSLTRGGNSGGGYGVGGQLAAGKTYGGAVLEVSKEVAAAALATLAHSASASSTNTLKTPSLDCARGQARP